MTRTGTTTRPLAVRDVTTGVDAVLVVTAFVFRVRTLEVAAMLGLGITKELIVGFRVLMLAVAATFGLGIAAELIVGVSSDPVVPAVATFGVVGGPAANIPG